MKNTSRRSKRKKPAKRTTILEKLEERTMLTCDFNGDQQCDAYDIDRLSEEVLAGTNNSLFDITGDTLVNQADREEWVLRQKRTFFGDANLDFAVDVTDLNHWNENKFTVGAGWAGGDFNGDGITDVDDFDVWNENKFNVAPGDTAPTVDTNPGASDPFSTTYQGNPVPVVHPDTMIADDSGVLHSLTIRIVNRPDGLQESLEVDNTGTTISQSYDPAAGTLTLSNSDTVAAYQALLRKVMYKNQDKTPDTTNRRIEIVAFDEIGPSCVVTTKVTIDAKNSIPNQEQLQAGTDCQPCSKKIEQGNDAGVASVFLHNGSFHHESVDLSIPGRGMDWSFARTYRSDLSFRGILGHNWDFNYNRRLRPVTNENLALTQRSLPDAAVGDVVYIDGFNRADNYKLVGAELQPPPGMYRRLVENPDGSFSETNRDGTVITYGVPADGEAHMTSRTDRDGNTMTFHYESIDPNDAAPNDEKFVLAYVIDTLGREIRYQYYARTAQTVNGRQITILHPERRHAAWGLLARVSDFKGDMDFDGTPNSDFPNQTNNRTVTFDYDMHGDLIAATSPAVTGTPTSNDFVLGKTETYTYTNGSDDSRQNHKLLSITVPNEVAVGGSPRYVLTYDLNLSSDSFGRVLTQTIGGTNASGVPAGGTIFYEHVALADPTDLETPARQMTVTDRNGNRTEYQFNRLNNVLRVEEFNRGVRPGDPGSYVTTYEWNDDYELERTNLPTGNQVIATYDDQPGTGRFSDGNTMSSMQMVDITRGGDQMAITSTATYEPIFQQIRTSTDPRENDTSYVPPNGGDNTAGRYTTTYIFDFQEGTEYADLGAKIGLNATEVQGLLTAAGIPMDLGDINGDGVTNQVNGKVVRTDYPTVKLLTGSNQAALEGDTQQDVFELFVYNRFGLLKSQTDPEGNVTEYEYFAEIDPDGDGNISPGPADGRILDTVTGGEGGGYLQRVIRDTTRNEIRNSSTDPTPTTIRTQYSYDDVGNMVRTVDGRGIADDYFINELNEVVVTTRATAHGIFAADPAEPLTLVNFQYVDRYFYDYNGNVVLQQTEDRGDTSIVDGNLPAGDLPVSMLLIRGTSTGANTSTTLNDTTQSFTNDQWSGQLIKITSGAGDGQVRTISENGATEITVATDWDTVPDATSTYVILPNPDPVLGPAFVDAATQFDILDQPLESLLEVTNGADGEFLRTRYRYDGNQNSVLTILPEGNATTAIYDERDLLFRSTRGALQPDNAIDGGTSTGGNTLLTLNDASQSWTLDEWGERTLLIVSGAGAGQARPIVSNTGTEITVGAAWQVIPDATSVYEISLTLLSPHDPIDYDVRGGLPCQCTSYRYDDNGNVIETADADDTDGSSENNSDLSGGDRTRYIYDGFDRLTSVVDSIGNQTVYQYDPAGNIIRTLHFGPVGGPSPTSDDPPIPADPNMDVNGDGRISPSDATTVIDSLHRNVRVISAALDVNQDGAVSPLDALLLVNYVSDRDADSTSQARSAASAPLPMPVSHNGIVQTQNLVNDNLLAASEVLHDELNRSYQNDQVLFINTIPTVRSDVADGAADLGKGNLTPGDTEAIASTPPLNINILGRVSTRTEFDRSSRTTFTVEDDEDTSRYFYDGEDRVIESLDPEGNEVQTAYDDNHNAIETLETDVAQIAGVVDEQFVTTMFYDSLNRVQQSVNNIGQSMFYRYDSRDNVVAMADAQGPLTGATITRRAFAGGVDTVNDINDFGNVTRYFYDGISRQTRQEVILTELPTEGGTAAGDGLHIGASIFGVKDDGTAVESFASPDVSQAGGDGIIRTGFVYDDNSLTTALIDDQGNVTLYLYDNLNRQVAETKGLQTTSEMDRDQWLGAREVLTPTAGTIDNPARVSHAQLDTQIAAAEQRIGSLAVLFPPLADVGTLRRQDFDLPATTDLVTFGGDVDLDGDVAIVGARTSGDAGKAFIYERSGADWLAVAELTADVTPGSDFGVSVALEGNTAVVGARFDATNGAQHGAAFVFEKIGASWQQVARLKVAAPVANDAFGWFVEISGDVIVVGDPQDDGGATNAGRAYVFVKPVNGWTDMTETASLRSPSPAPADRLGSSVGISGDTVVAGSPLDGTGVRGAAFVFVKPAGGWTSMAATATLTSSDRVDGDQFGQPVAISGDTIIAGSRFDNADTGSAYIFTRPANGWANMTETAKLTASDGTDDDRFGIRVAIEGDFAIVGTNPRDTSLETKSYVFEMPASGWQSTTESYLLSQPDSALVGGGARTVAFDGTRAIVGSGGVNGLDGTVSVHDLAKPTTILYGYDPDDNVLILEDENDNEIFTKYDGINRAIATRVFRSGQNDSHAGDPLFAPNPTSDPSNPSGSFPAIIGTHKQDYEYDGLSRLTLATDNNDPEATSDDSVVAYAYDSLSRVIEETQTIGALPTRAISTAWRAENLRSGLTYPDGRALEYTYDDLDRLQTITDMGAALPIVDYDYIGVGRVLVRAYPQNGTRMTYLNDAGTLDIGYDGLRRPAQLRHLRSDDSLIVGFTHVYDRMNNKLTESKLHDPVNSEVYGYDATYRLVDFKRPQVGSTQPTQSEWSLDGLGNWDQIDGESREHSSINEITVRDDGRETTLGYDNNGNQTFGGAGGLRYHWDFRNRLQRVTRDEFVLSEFNGTGFDYKFEGFAQTVGADSVRLQDANGNGGAGISRTMDLSDLADSRWVVDLVAHPGNGANVFEMELIDIHDNTGKWLFSLNGITPNAPIRLVSATTLDDPQSGVGDWHNLDLANIKTWQILGDYGTTAAFDISLDRIVFDESVVIAVYSYDAANRRIRKVITNSDSLDGTTDYYYDGWRVLEEHDGTDGVTQQYVYGNYLDEVLTLDNRRGGVTVAELNDGVGNQRHVYHINTLFHVYGLTDETGALVEAYQYDAYGEQTIITDGPNGDRVVSFTADDVRAGSGQSKINNVYLYTGQRFDAESQLLYFKQRYADNRQGRFTSRDRLGYHDAMGLYEYAGTRPIQISDPLGLETYDSTIWVTAGKDLDGDIIRLGEVKFTITKESCKDGGGVMVTNPHWTTAPGKMSLKKNLKENIGSAVATLWTKLGATIKVKETQISAKLYDFESTPWQDPTNNKKVKGKCKDGEMRNH